MSRPLLYTALSVAALAAALFFASYGFPGCGPDAETERLYQAHLDAARDSTRLATAALERIEERTAARVDSLTAALEAEHDARVWAEQEAEHSARAAARADAEAERLRTVYAETGEPSDCGPALDACTAARIGLRRALGDEQAVTMSLRREIVLVSEQRDTFAGAYDSLRIAVIPAYHSALSHAEAAAEAAALVSYDAGCERCYGRGVWVGRLQVAVPVALVLVTFAVLQ